MGGLPDAAFIGTQNSVCGILALLFIAVPALEIYVLIGVGNQIGALATLGVIVFTGVLGAALARYQGLASMRELARALAERRKVARAGVQAVLVLVAGVLLLTPGFVTDGVGFALLLPPVRRMVAERIVARYARRAVQVVMPGGMPGFPGMGGHDSGAGRARAAGDQGEPRDIIDI